MMRRKPLSNQPVIDERDSIVVFRIKHHSRLQAVDWLPPGLYA